MRLGFNRKRSTTTAVGIAIGVLLAVVVPIATTRAGQPATEAFDYTRIAGLSQPIYTDEEIRKDALELPMADGVTIYIEVTRPTDGTPHPVILESSPYHGTLHEREGARIFPGPDGTTLTSYFVPRGYAVVMMDLRGTGRSRGCLDHLGPRDAADLKTVVEWAAGQPWSNGRVGMTGHSYVGSTPSLAAAMKPRGLATIVPSAGLAHMYSHQFQAGVPFFLQWAGTMEAYEELALQRKLPGGEDFGNNMEDTGCGMLQSSLVAGEDQLSGRYSWWHKERDWRAGATAADIPIFMVHGVNDNAARVDGIEWFTRRKGRAGDKLWLGQWDHGSDCCPNRRGIQWVHALHAWFDRHLAGRGVDTGPAVELFLSDGSFEEATEGDREQILVADRWPPANASMLTLYPTEDGRLGAERPPTLGSVSFTGDPLGFEDPQATGGVEFATEPMPSDLMLAGQPKLDLVASVTVERVHLIANLYDEDPSGGRRRISQFAINPELRDGLDRVDPIVPLATMHLKPPGFAMAHDLRAGHRLVLRVTTSDPDKVPTFAVDPLIRVFTGPAGTPSGSAVHVPVVRAPELMADAMRVELEPESPPAAAAAPPQKPVRGSVTPAAPGLGLRAEGITSEFLEFDVEAGRDNAALVATAVPSLPGDFDLFLQRQADDGSWGEDITDGQATDLSGERLASGRPEPGRYRLEVHSYTALPATRVDLTITFLDSATAPG